MKAILEFDLPEENSEFQLAAKGADFALAWNGLREYLSKKLKYEKLNPAVWDALNDARKHMIDTADERELPEIL
jgi:hypothetical protein